MKKLLLILLLALPLFTYGQSELVIPNSVKVNNGYPTDWRYGPWIDVATAKAAVTLGLRFDGLTVMIAGVGEYWWTAADLTDTGLIVKSAGGGGGTWGSITGTLSAQTDLQTALNGKWNLSGTSTLTGFTTIEGADNGISIGTSGSRLSTLFFYGPSLSQFYLAATAFRIEIAPDSYYQYSIYNGSSMHNSYVSTSTVDPVLTIYRKTSGTAANGIGSYIQLAVENSTGGYSNGLIEFSLLDATSPGYLGRYLFRAPTPTGGSNVNLLGISEHSFFGEWVNSLSIGKETATASTMVDVVGIGTTTGKTLRLANSADTERFSFLDNGTFNIGVAPTTSTAGELLLRNTSSGAVEKLGIGSGLSISGSNLIASGGGSGTVTNVSSANADITVATGTSTPVLTMVQSPALRSATTTINVSSATAPTVGQVLTATSGTAATWQTAAGGSGLVNQTLTENITIDGNYNLLFGTSGSRLAYSQLYSTGPILFNSSGAIDLFAPAVAISDTLSMTLAPETSVSGSDHILTRNVTTGRVQKLGIGSGLSISGGNLISSGAGGFTSGSNVLTSNTDFTGAYSWQMGTSGSRISGIQGWTTGAVIMDANTTMLLQSSAGTAIHSSGNISLNSDSIIFNAPIIGLEQNTFLNGKAHTLGLTNITGFAVSASTAELVFAGSSGTSGQVLTSDGTYATWQTPSGGGGGGDALTTNPLSQFAATTSLQLKNTISDETGSGALVFATSPSLVTPSLGVATATSINGATITSGSLNGSVTGTNTGDNAVNSLYSGLVTNATHTGDVTGATALTIGANKILESHLKAVNSPTDEYVLTYEATTGDFEWQVGGGSGTVTSVSSANADLSITSGTTAAVLTIEEAPTTRGLESLTTTVDVSGSTAPTAGQVLTATNSTNGEWKSADARITTSRDVTSASASVQTDNRRIIWLNSGSAFNFTLDQLTTNTLIDFVNIGAGTVTFINGTGVTLVGTATLVSGATATVVYRSTTSPYVIQ